MRATARHCPFGLLPALMEVSVLLHPSTQHPCQDPRSPNAGSHTTETSDQSENRNQFVSQVPLLLHQAAQPLRIHRYRTPQRATKHKVGSQDYTGITHCRVF
ncbi:hypothetical protein B0H67DRAFT_119089 [Lasiosphaeris hirsuta]|uniref:Secreted protein n=1 Tax=Lasiosphaeris hirsuta TaxID=260670 RepID=A0AA40E765_9PEZI|nr:hypothetical protein B0H67DRAFT_119089 [Lasiosphaeris hirsuta]